jgi:hypothetical protein
MAFKHAIDGDTAEAGKWEIAGIILRVTDKGVQFNDGFREAWLPKRFVTTRSGKLSQGPAVVFLPEWLAKKEKFI